MGKLVLIMLWLDGGTCGVDGSDGDDCGDGDDV